MKYTLEERLEIGRQIYTRELTNTDAAFKYNVDIYTARSYMRLYRDKNNLPPVNEVDSTDKLPKVRQKKPNKVVNYEDLESMTKDQLIDEVIKARIETERTKKGYQVKGDGQGKEFISINNMNTK